MLGLQSLEHRRLISDLVMCLDIIYGNNALAFDAFFLLQPTHHPEAIHLNFRSQLLRRMSVNTFFSSRVVPVWKALPPNLV